MKNFKAITLSDKHKICFKPLHLVNETHKVYNIESDYKVSKEDVIYIYPGCSIPRYKLRDNYKLTIKPINADVIVLPDNYDNLIANEHIHKEYHNCIPVEKIIKYLDYNGFDKECKKLRALSSLNNIDKVFIDLLSSHSLTRRYDLGPYALHNILDTTEYKLRRLSKNNMTWNDYAEAVIRIPYSSKLRDIKSDVKYIYEKDVLSFINNDSIDIDSNKYEELVSIAKSEDPDNVKMVMQLMANSNYDKSYAYILMLIKEFGHKFRSHKFSNSVDFRSLLSYFKIDKTKMIELTIMDLAKKLKQQKKFTKKNVFIIQQLCQDDWINYNCDDVQQYFKEGPVISKHFSNFDK